MSHNSLNNEGVHIRDAVASTKCAKHGAEEGVPCWILPKAKGYGEWHFGICGLRIRKAGFNGKISPQSIRSNEYQKKMARGIGSGDRKFAKNKTRVPVTSSK